MDLNFPQLSQFEKWYFLTGKFEFSLLKVISRKNIEKWENFYYFQFNGVDRTTNFPPAEFDMIECMKFKFLKVLHF